MTNCLIRPERISDYNRIAALNYNTFVRKEPTYYKSEPLVTAVLRHSQYFDPELSLVAEVAGRVVGHALFSPFEFVVLGERRRGVFLAPLAVDNGLQGQGIGSRLMEAGHRVALDKGYSLSVLCGIPEYYPRFGYQQRAFAHTGVTIELNGSLTEPPDVSERPVLESDLSWILARWQQLHANDRLAWFPGTEISQWFNHSLAYRSSVITQAGQRVAYVKYRQSAPLRINELLTEEGAGAVVLAHLAGGQSAESGWSFAASMRTEAILAQLGDCQRFHARPDIRTSEALMLKVLDDADQLLYRYCLEAVSDLHNLGILAFPTLMDIDN